MEGWDDLGYPVMQRPGVELATSQSHIHRWRPVGGLYSSVMGVPLKAMRAFNIFSRLHNKLHWLLLYLD